MTAIIAAAAQALDLTGDVVGNDVAPSDAGVLFLPDGWPPVDRLLIAVHPPATQT
ncbi:hypothetical protein [Micromonospora sp. L32]|uniref:hypothetical protein n=1 Tax=Micromonospora sp. L32 TaxID=3452214 RepID=UPI003F8A4B40